tara:strand:- start:26230 stop:26505 length:276 start_codon:yes stop_codon:yes gene_type:complete
MIIGIWPALKSEALATGPAEQAPDGRATAVAGAKVVKPFKLDSAVQPGSAARDSAITVLRRSTVRSCQAILGTDGNQVAEATCELRLIELQ